MASRKQDVRPVFISYARGSSFEVAKALWSGLGGEQGSAFLDTSTIQYGHKFAERIISGIFASRVIVLILDKLHLERPYCVFERKLALTDYHDLKKQPVRSDRRGKVVGREAALANALKSIVIVLPDAPDPCEADLIVSSIPPELRKINWPRASETSAIIQHIEERLGNCRRSLGQRLGKDRAAIHRQLFNEEMSVPAKTGVAAVPHSPSPFPDYRNLFSGRAEELDELHSLLNSHGRVAICAAAGFGKTRLAIEYVHRHGTTRFKGGLFWIDASKSDTGIEDQLYQIACVIRQGRPARDNDPPIPDLKTLRNAQVSIRGLLRTEIRSTDPRKEMLFILDNLPERTGEGKLARLTDFCADETPVRVLGTSRDLILEDNLLPLRLQLLEKNSAVALLTSGVDRKNELTFDHWATIAAWAGCFPLALDLLNGTLRGPVAPLDILQAAAAHISSAETVDDLSKNHRSLLENGFTSSLAAGITEAFQLSFDKLTPPARKAAELLSQLGPFSIPVLVRNQLPDEIASDAALAELNARHYLQDPGFRSIGRMHAMVADFIRGGNPADKENLRSALSSLLAAMGLNQGTNPDLWPELNDCCLHSEVLSQRAFERTDLDEEPTVLVIQLALLATVIQEAQMKFDNNDKALVSALAESRARLGEGHRCTFTVRWKMVDRHQTLGRTEKAREELTSMVSLARVHLNGDDPMLAGMELMLQFMDSAAPEPEPAASIAPADEESTSLVSKLRLTTEIGRLLPVPEQWPQAIDLARALVERFRREFGNEHEWTLDAMSLLARCLSLRGDAEEACEWWRKVYAGILARPKDLSVHGEGELSFSTALLEWADTLADSGDLDAAHDKQAEAVALRRRFFKQKHIATLEAEAAFAETLRRKGKLSESEDLFRRIIKTANRRALEAIQADTMKFTLGLSQTLRDQGKVAEAVECVEGVLDRLKAGGAQAEQIALWTHRLAEARAAQGEIETACALETESAQLYEQVFGPEHRITLQSKLNVTQKARRKGDPDGAFRAQLELLDTCRRVFGTESQSVVSTLIALARTAGELGDTTASEGMAAEAWAIAGKIVGPHHPLFRQLSRLEGGPQNTRSASSAMD